MNYFKYFRDELIKTMERLADLGQVPAGLDLARVAADRRTLLAGSTTEPGKKLCPPPKIKR